MIVPLAILAALDECMTGVDMAVVQKYRTMYIEAVPIPPIQLRKKNQRGYYFVEDGHHRIIAAFMDHRSRIDAELISGAPVELSWRWPRIAPITTTALLMLECGVFR